MYATTLGTVFIPAPGYYYNVPLYAVPAPSNSVAVRRANFTDPAQAGYRWVPTSYPIRRSSYTSTRDVEENPGWQSASGNYATTLGTVFIPAPGHYSLYAVPAPGNPAPAQGSTYSSFYSAVNAPRYAAPAPRYTAPAYRSKYDLERPDWQSLR